MSVDVGALQSRCEAGGFDVVHPFCLDWFNGEVEPPLRLSDFGRPRALAIVIGNSAHLWPAFRRALDEDPRLRSAEHPLDTYVERTLTAAFHATVATRHVLFFAHHMNPAPIAIQRIAHASGLAYLSPSRLSVHPEFGPWIALRAVAVVDVEGPRGERPLPHDPCTSCAKPCLAAFDRALALSGATNAGEVERQWQAWADVRDVCPEGKAHRYGDDQLRYHYTKDRSILR